MLCGLLVVNTRIVLKNKLIYLYWEVGYRMLKCGGENEAKIAI